MPTAKPRITITLEKHSHEVLSRLSAASGDSMSQIVASFVDLALPSLERVVVVLEQARAAPEKVRAGLVAAVERAERDMLPAMVEALDQSDLFLSDLTKATAKGRGAPAAQRAARPDPLRVALEAAVASSTPVPVTRGLGGGKTLRERTKGARRG